VATVVRAIERESGRVVALKRLRPQFAGDASHIRDFLREARIAQSLNHPNIVRVYAVGQIDGVHYMSMEWILGKTLRSVMDRCQVSSPLPLGVSLWIVRELLRALDYVAVGINGQRHPWGLLHRDISPSNVIITPEGDVKLIDFGLAKSLSGRFATNSGIAKGRLGYMAPEALCSNQLGTASDLYSVAVLAWELLANRRLFGGATSEQLAARAGHRLVAPSSFRRGISRDIDDLVAVGLAKDPDQRWPSAAAMAGVLNVVTRRCRREAGPEAWIAWCARDDVHPSRIVPAITATLRTDLGHITTLPAMGGRAHKGHGFGPSCSTVMDPVDDPTGRHRLAMASSE
jgi:serine/threonine-protein kinase